MQTANKDLCRIFENEVWLYISGEMDADRKKSWDNHLEACRNCAHLLESNKAVSGLYRENMEEDMLDSVFDKMIEKAVSKPSLLRRIREGLAGWNSSFSFGKAVLGSTLAGAALIIVLLSQKPVPVASIPAEQVKWDDPVIKTRITEITTAIRKLEGSTKSSDAECSEYIKGIESRIDSLKFCINN